MADKDVLGLPGEFDRLLGEELSIEPSPAFAARVRARAAEQRPTPWWRARWIPTTGYLATVASIAIAITVPALKRSTSSPVPPTPPALRHTAVQHPRLDPSALPGPVTARSRVSARPASAGRPSDPDVPLVIVDGRERIALERFVSMVKQGRVGDEAFAHRSRPETAAIKDSVSLIVVAPVTVSGIAVSGVLPSEQERK